MSTPTSPASMRHSATRRLRKNFVGRTWSHPARTRSSLLAMGFLKPDMPVVDFAEWSKGTPLREDPADGPALGRGRLRHACRHAPVLRLQDPALHPGRLAVRAGHQGHRRLHERGAVVVGADRVPEGRALHHAVRGHRSRVRIRAAEQPVLPADGVDPVLVAAQHHSAATVAEPGAVDKGHRPRADGCPAVRGAAGGARCCAVLRRHRTDACARHHRRGAAAVADLDDPRASWRSRDCGTR